MLLGPDLQIGEGRGGEGRGGEGRGGERGMTIRLINLRNTMPIQSPYLNNSNY